MCCLVKEQIGDRLNSIPKVEYLVKNVLAVITDSGGITEKSTILGVCLRDSTERPETITMGTNELVGTNPDYLNPYIETLFAGKWKKGQTPRLWDGKVAERLGDTWMVFCR